MTNLPITPNTPQTAAAPKQAANAAETGDMQNSQPFEEVLARQISDPAASNTKTTDKLAVDALAQLTTDTVDSKKEVADSKQTGIAATNSATELPTDMLAALLPQGMNTTNSAGTTSVDTDTNTNTNAKSDRTASSANPRDIASPKADAAATIQTDATQKSSKGANPGIPAGKPSFTATLTESAKLNASDVELKSVVREAIALATQKPATAPQANATAFASLQNTAVSVAASAAQPVQITINTPVNQNKWHDEFSQKITWLTSSGQDQTAELHLNPPKLGPLDVVIKVNGDQATAQFTSSHAAVREAVELAMPRLRDMLADNGITLGNTTVSDQAPRDQNQSGTQRASDSGNNIQDTPAENKSTARVSPISRHDGIVDTFA